jgi:hypothetical protein
MIFRVQQILAEFIREIKIQLTRHFSVRVTAPNNAALISAHHRVIFWGRAREILFLISHYVRRSIS